MSEMRINARLDEQSVSDLQFLRSELGDRSVTDVLKYALKQAAQDLRDRMRAKQQKQIWRSSGFVGCFAGPEDMSVNYKKRLAEILDEKYPVQK